MPFTETTSTAINTGLDDIQTKVARAKVELDNLRVQAIKVHADMTALQDAYTGLDTAANTLLADQPANLDRQAIVARAADYTADFLVVKSRAQAIKDALGSL